jgi:hypothetical protein
MNNRKSDRALYLAVVICAASAYALSQMGCAQLPPTGEPFPESLTAEIWLPESSPLYAAQKAWGLPARAVPEFRLVPGSEVASACGFPSYEYVMGCTTLEIDRVLVRWDMPAPDIESTKVHEMGHFLAHKLSHVSADLCAEGSHLMCLRGTDMFEPTPEDFDWAFSQ